MNKTTKIVLFSLYTALKIALLAVTVLFFFLYYLLFGRMFPANIYYLSYLLIPLALLFFTAWLLPKSKVRKGFWWSVLALFLAGAVALSACLGYNAYIGSLTLPMPADGAIDPYEYLAFDENSKIARLGKPASLRFSAAQNLPVLDGAAAFFPLYSSFTEAVYPEEVCKLNAKDSPYRYSNTIGAYSHLIEGNADIIFVFGPDSDQKAYAEEQGVEFELIPIGYEGFVFFTNAKNPVKDVTAEEIRDIYAGRVTNWKELGGKNEKIQPFQRNRGSGSQTALEAFMGDVPLMDPPTELVNDFMWGIIEKVSDYINYGGAIGFSFRQYAETLVGNENISFLSVDGVAPTRENIVNGSYPIRMPFYAAVRKGERSAEADALLGWILSDEGQSLVAASGYAPL